MRILRQLALLAFWTFGSLVLSREAGATERSALEERSLARALGPHPDFDDAPESKRIESVEIVRLPVFDDDDPVPDFVNLLHVQTRERVIRHELLFRPGQRYDSERIQETIRNLQLLPQFGVVVVVALRGSEPGQVRVVVIVRDVWSLRPAWELKGSPSYVNYLLVNLVETNLFGTRASLGGIFSLRSDRYSLGAMGRYPRIAGTKIDALGQALAFVNLGSGQVEGSFGAFAVQRDLVSLDDKWGFLAGVAWLDEWTRVPSGTSGVHVRYWPPDASIENRLLEVRGVPLEYRTSVVRTGAEIARQFGRQDKTILTSGVEFSRRRFEPPSRSATVSAEDFAAFVQNEIPVSDTRLSPFIEVENRSAKYLATRDVETLELQESFTLGQHAVLRLYPALRDLGSSRNLLGSVAWLGYTQRLGNGFARAVVSSSIEAAQGGKHQAYAQGGLRIVSPRASFMRVIFDAAAVETYRNYLNRKITLGGESRPRGYINSGLRGDSGFAGTLELRTFALDLLSARVGAVAFYDVAGAGASIHSARPVHSVGAGVRVLFPQFNRQIFRIDWAVPLSRSAARVPDRALPGAFYFSFGQAFDLPRVRLPQVLGTPTTLVELVE